jgi:hypothetical protein
LLVLLDGCVIAMDVGLDLPRAGLEWRAHCGAPFARVALVFGQLRGRDAVLPPAFGHR